jgi:hypothetical protein
MLRFASKVLYLFVVETANTGICVAMIYEPLVGQFGTRINPCLLDGRLLMRMGSPSRY